MIRKSLWSLHFQVVNCDQTINKFTSKKFDISKFVFLLQCVKSDPDPAGWPNPLNTDIHGLPPESMPVLHEECDALAMLEPRSQQAVGHTVAVLVQLQEGRSREGFGRFIRSPLIIGGSGLSFHQK